MNRILTARHLVIVLTLVIDLSSCDPKHDKKSEIREETQKKILTTEKLPLQTFSIDSERDTILKGKAGAVLRIYKNTFTGNDGKPINGRIAIKLKEAFIPIDIILSGLTTTSNGQILETGGMIYINATASGQQLEITNNKFIGVIIPNGKIESGMKLFEGELDSSGINWKNPKPILNEKILARNDKQLHPSASDLAKVIIKKVSKDEIDEILNYVESDTIKPDAQKAVRKKNKLIKQPELGKKEDDIFLNEIKNEKGTNLFLEDYRFNYLLSLKKLGWANIDRLYQDPRTKEVEFITSVENQKEFKQVYITLLITNKGMYIPGYQRKDETFSFTHNDEEAAQLPIGESATILATAYKNGKPYYSIKTIKISEKQTVVIKLEETTDDKLKDALTRQL